MKVFIDGIIYEYQSYGGIPRIFNEILPRMCEIEENLLITLLLFNQPKNTLPKHPRVIERRLFISSELLRMNNRLIKGFRLVSKYATRLLIGDTHKKIWHSTYYSQLPKWDGPKIVSAYDFIYEKDPEYFSDSSEIISRKKQTLIQADIVICLSTATKNDLKSTYQIPDERIRIIYPACSSIFSMNMQLQERQKSFFLYIGGRAKYKGFIDLLEAYARCSKKDQTEIMVVGQPFIMQEYDLIKKLGLQNKVILRTDISDDELCDLYNQAKAFVYPSWIEGFGIPLLEAMACGCPIVASRIPTTLEVAGDIPIYFKAGAIDDLAATLEQVSARNPDPRRIDQGLERVKTFSWDKTARATLDIYRAFLT